MALNRPRDLFTPEWVAGLRGAPESAMAAQITLAVQDGPKVYDPDTDTWTIPEVVLYAGKARVQPLRSASRRPNPGNATTALVYLFSIPVSENTLDIRPGQVVRVTSAPLNPTLTTYDFRVQEIGDSSNIIERTFQCVINQETAVT